MGLTTTPRRAPVRNRGRIGVYAAALLLAVVAAAGCVKELDLPTPTQSTTFVDGAVIVDSAVQRLRFGFTVGLGQRAFPIPEAEIEVVNLSTGERYPYLNVGEVNYRAAFTPGYGEAYQLVIRLPDVAQPYRSRPDSLEPAALTLSGVLARQTRLNRDGIAVERAYITARTTVGRGVGAPLSGVLTVRQSLVWAYADVNCGPFDPSRICYFVEGNEEEPSRLIDLTTIGSAGATTFEQGAEFIDYRVAEQAYFVLASRRYSAAAGRYLSTYNVALAPSGTPFDERLLPAVGNVEGPAEAPGILGYFGVAEARIVVLPVNDAPAGVRGFPNSLCSGFPLPTGFDCCECLRSPGALAEKPSYLP